MLSFVFEFIPDGRGTKMSQQNPDLEKQNFATLPTGKNEDVEFSEEQADDADRIALKRVEEADARAQAGATQQAQRLF